MDPTKTLIVKLKNDTGSGSGSKLIRSIVRAVDGGAVRDVEPIFPDDDEPDLSTLFNVTLHPSTSADRVLDALRGDPNVQYAHTPATRRSK